MLAGRLPLEITRMPLKDFLWIGNQDLCQPDTSAFSKWLANVAGRVSAGEYCNLSDRDALATLYDAAGGSGWTNASGWPDGPVDSRHGVKTDASNRVVAINLSGNGLAGILPGELGDLALLEELRLGGNPQLSGRLPYTLARIGMLRELRYVDTDLCVPQETFLREWLSKVPQHEGTGVACKPSADRDVLESIYKSMAGEQWHNSRNWLSDAPLREWHGVRTDGQGRVVRLDLSFNRLRGPIPADIAGLEELTDLILTANDTGNSPLPPEIGELTNLKNLELAGIFATGPLPPRIGQLARLESLDLSGNELSGSIPPEVGGLTSLTELHLGENRLAGSIPPQLANATKLKQIHLADNDLSGALPRNLPSLAELYLGSNSLSGPLPSELANLTQLRALGLTNNTELTGPLPARLADLREMVHLQAEGTGLCAPQDAKLLGWLNGLLTRRIGQCGIEPAAAYLTQAVQSFHLPIALVAGEQALLRVFPTAEQTNSERIPRIQADLFLAGALRHEVDIPSSPGPIPTRLDESLSAKKNNGAPAEKNNGALLCGFMHFYADAASA